MKLRSSSTFLQLVFIALVGLTGASLQGAESVSEFNHMDLKTCTTDQSVCLTVKAEKAVGTPFSSVHALKNVTAERIEKKSGKIQTYSSSQGYLDFEFHKVVLTEFLSSNVQKEIEVDLNTLKTRVGLMK